MKGTRRAASLVLALCLLLLAAPAHAWLDTHVVSDEMRVEVERAGTALIDHAITLRVQGGPLRSFDLAVGDPDATPLGDGTVIGAHTEGLLGIPVPLTVSPRPDGALRVNIESSRGISRGTYLFHVRYRKNLLAGTGDNLRRDGAMLRLRLLGPVWQEGLDNAQCTFVLSPAPTEPRAGNDPGSDGSDDPAFFVSRVTRSKDRDEVELIRPHVARGEVVAWIAHIDPRALGEVNDPRLKPLAPPPPPQSVSPEQRAGYIAGALAMLVGFSVLVAQKTRQVHEHARGIALVRPLLPLGSSLRTLLAGPVLTAGVLLQAMLDEPFVGTALVLFAMGIAWYRQPIWKRVPRGPGRWLPVSDAEAFGAAPLPRGAWLDASTRRGACILGAALAILGVIALAMTRVSAYGAYLVLFDSAVLFPLFGTGNRRNLPPHPVHGPARLLRRIAWLVRKAEDARVIAWGRLPEGGTEFDELRLLCSPKLPRRGFVGIEVGQVTATGLGGPIALPEILVRVIDGSPSHEAFRQRLPGSRWVRGRKADERVTTVTPRLPTAAMTATLAGRLLAHAQEKADQSCSASSLAKGANAGNAASRSAGKPERTAKSDTLAPPLHAT